MGDARPSILTFVNHYLPGYKSGGPVRTIANMVDHLSNELDFWIVTSDRDAMDTEPFPNVAVDTWNRVGPAKVFYASPTFRSLQSFARLMRKTPYDVLYLNSFFDYVFTLLPLLAMRLGLAPRRATVIAPRGEFSQGAFALKAWKKGPYCAASKLLGLYRNLVWQASSQFESEDIRRIMGSTAKTVFVAQDLPPKLQPLESISPTTQSNGGPLRAVFLSRITPMKNLDFALRVLSRVNVPVQFHIYGPIGDEAFWMHCQKFIRDLPENIKVCSCGSIKHNKVHRVLSSYDLFFLPTRGENFGHVILEALSSGTPVLISDQTPWQSDSEGGCTVLKLDDEDSFAGAIEDFANLTSKQRKVRRKAAREAAMRFCCNEELRRNNIMLFRIALLSVNIAHSAPNR